MENRSHEKILIVDDESGNLAVLRQALKDEWNLVFAKSGPDALAAAANHQPLLILLDIMMHGMDGYEVCSRLKADPETAHIAVIFITAMTEVSDESRGFKLGAVDYIAKPVSPEIVRARVRTQLELIAVRKELENRNLLLTQAMENREDMENIIRHDLKAPLTSIIGFPKLLLEDEELDDRSRVAFATILDSGYHMLNMINTSLDMAKMEHGTYDLRPEKIDLVGALNRVFGELSHQIDNHEVTVEVAIDGGSADNQTFFVLGEELLFHAILSNLLKNAIEASPFGGTITAEMESAAGTLRLTNSGEVPADLRDHFFEKYATAGKKGGIGLGTYSARLMMETLRGAVTLDASHAGRTTIVLDLPRDTADAGEEVARGTLSHA